MKFGLLLFGIFISLSLHSLFAQQSVESEIPFAKYGLYANSSLNTHSADFRAFPGVPNCCPKFQSGSGSGLSFGILYDIPFSSEWIMSLRGGYENYSAKLTTREPELLAGGIQGEFEHRVTTGLASVGIETWLGYGLFRNLTVSAGIRAGYVVQRDFSQVEVIVQPNDNGVFSNGKSSRNDTSGIIPNANLIAVNLLAGVSYELPLNSRNTLFLVPEFQFSFGLLPIISGYDWQSHGIHFGIALKYLPKYSENPSIIPQEPKQETSPISNESKPPIPIIIETHTTATPEKKKPLLSASITAVGINEDSTEHPLNHIQIEEFASTALHPLLQYVFFDENSSQIPTKYTRIEPEDADKFSLRDYIGANSMEVYYSVLNIVGYRMKTTPKSVVTLTGCNSNESDEKNNIALSRSRAESVKKYLVEVWGIEPKRLKIEQRNLPIKSSNSSTKQGREENRRVEISSDEGEIITAIIIDDTIRTVTPSIIRFHPTASAEAGIEDWSVSAIQQQKLSMKYEGKSALQNSVDWNISNEIHTIRMTNSIQYSFEIQDNAKQDTIVGGTIPIEQMTIHKKREEKLSDKIIDRYHLILFDFDKANIDKRNQSILSFVKKRISADARVSITGFTDLTGDEEHNTRLAQLRAKATVRGLGLKANVTETKGKQQFTNTTPEGRYYNRTVEILVETPVK
jgi:outer membrane protein OmpA-like peptidoglycan-associated protein